MKFNPFRFFAALFGIGEQQPAPPPEVRRPFGIEPEKINDVPDLLTVRRATDLHKRTVGERKFFRCAEYLRKRFSIRPA